MVFTYDDYLPSYEELTVPEINKHDFSPTEGWGYIFWKIL